MLSYRVDERISDFAARAYRRAPTSSTEDSGRMSSSSNNTSPKHSVRFLDEASEICDWDSGVEENHDASPRRRSPASPDAGSLTSTHLHQCAIDFVVRLRSLIASVDFFRRLAGRESNASDDLLQELRRKLKPRLVVLDEAVSEIVDTVKTNIDQCRITDRRLTLLLIYNGFLMDTRDLLGNLMAEVLDELEEHLSVLERGARVASGRCSSAQRALAAIDKTAQRLESNVRDEGTRQMQHSPASSKSSASSESRTK